MASKEAKNIALKRERQKRRAGKGALRDNLIKPLTKEKYNMACAQFYDYLALHRLPQPKTKREFDRSVADYMEYLWEENEAKDKAGSLLSGLSHNIPPLRGNLQETWRLYDVWGKLEQPVRAAPLLPGLLLGILGLSLGDRDMAFAAVTATAFQGLLRTGEMLGLKKSDIVFDFARSRAVLSLNETKTSGRNRTAEFVIIDDVNVVVLLASACSTLQPGDFVYSASAHIYRNKFREYCKSLGLSALKYKPYSLRRGGATHLYKRSANFGVVLERGRWKNLSTVRIYVQQALAAVEETSLSPRQLRVLESATLFYRAFVRQPSFISVCQKGERG